MDNEGGEDMEARHLREKNELQEKVAELKKSIQKADKKKKKEVNAEILRLEGDLNEKHSAEIMEQMLENVSIEDENVEESTKEEVKVELNQSNDGQRVSKAQKRRDKKAEKEVCSSSCRITQMRNELQLLNSGKTERRN